MIDKRLNDFKEEQSCTYKGEEYLVRDNGAIFRKNRPNKKPRKNDNNWYFGEINNCKKWLDFCGQRVHRIVATAFLGAPLDEHWIVHHIDGNKLNNSASNLLWITKLEKILFDKSFRKTFQYNAGVNAIEFFCNPTFYSNRLRNTNFEWVCNEDEEEFGKALEKYFSIEKEETVITTRPLYNQHYYITTETESDKITDSLTANAKQKNWKTPTNFVCCPSETIDEPISSYFENLFDGIVIAINKYGEHLVHKCARVNDDILVITVPASIVKSYALMKITYEDGFYIHESQGTFFTPEGAEKQFTLAQGLEWTGGDSLDDYC